MSIKQLVRDDDAVSPVIGVILMVEITVILAAVIGAFVLGLGDSLNDTAPTVSTSTSTNSDWSGTDTEALYITHQSGDSIEIGDLRIVVRDTDGAAVTTLDSSNSWGDGETITAKLDGDSGSDITESHTFSPGSTITLEDSDHTATDTTNGMEAGGEYTIQIIHTSSGTTIGESTVNLVDNT